MNYPTIEQAQDLLTEHLKEDFMLKHSRETEVIMRALAKHFEEDEEFWGVTGLLHDLDFEQTGENNADAHGPTTIQILTDAGLAIPDEMKQAILSHNEEYTKVARESKLDYCLSAAENLTGLIVAYTLMRPDKKLEGVKAKSITKKFKDKSFAAKVNRDLINDIEKTGLERSEFFTLAIAAMQEIADELGF